MKTQKLPKSTCTIEGEFLGFIPKPGGNFKYIQVQVGERVIPIELAKEFRETLRQELVEGDRLSIFLEQEGSGNFSKLKLKSDETHSLQSKTGHSPKASLDAPAPIRGLCPASQDAGTNSAVRRYASRYPKQRLS